MTTIKAYVLIAVALVLGLGIGYFSNNGATKVGGTVENFPTQFVNGLKAGPNSQLTVDSSGNITTSGSISSSNTTSNSVVNNLVVSGSVTSISTTSSTYTLTAANICNSSYIKFTPLAGTTTVTLPASTTLTATCLTAVGQSLDLNYESTATSTVIAAGAGETLGYTLNTSILAGKHGLLRFIRDGANTVDVYLVNITN